MASRDQLVTSFGLELAVPLDSGPELSEEEEAVHSSYEEVSLLLGDRDDQGSGRLYITTRHSPQLES